MIAANQPDANGTRDPANLSPEMASQPAPHDTPGDTSAPEPLANPQPVPLRERSAAALEWPRLRELIARRTQSTPGRARTVALEPTTDLPWINLQQDRIDELRALLAAATPFSFSGLFEPGDLLAKSRVPGAALESLEILQILHLAELTEAWRALAAEPPSSVATRWAAITALSEPILLASLDPLLAQLRNKIEPDGNLADDASPELARIRRALERQHRNIQDSLRRSLRSIAEAGAIQDEVITLRGDRFTIPVKAELRRRVPGVIHGSSSTGQTVFIEPMETVEANNELLRLLDEEQSEIHRILVAMTRAVGQHADTLVAAADILAELDTLTARAKFAEQLDCLRPTFTSGSRGYSNDGTITLRSARHPLLALRLAEEGVRIIPLTLILEGGSRQLIISGPNTGGKTVGLKTLGLLALMAQAGLPVPATEAALPLFDAVFADIGDAQSIERNLSTFSAHITNVDRITREAGADSLVLLDELGSATDPEEGAALAVAIAGHFLRRRAWSLISTHLNALKIYAATHPGVVNAAVGFDQATLAPTYELRLGVPGASAGLNIAARLGLSPDIIADARAALSTQTADIGAFLDELHSQITAANEERSNLRRREHEVRMERERLEAEGRAEQRQRTRELETKLNALIADVDAQLKDTVKAIDDKTLAGKVARDSALRMARLRREFSEQFTGTVAAHNTKPTAAAQQRKGPKPLKVGDLVRLKSLNREARISTIIDDRNLEVAIGQLKMRVSRDDLAEHIPGPNATPLHAGRGSSNGRRGNITVQSSMGDAADYVPMELNVIGRTADEAKAEVERYIDQAFLAGLPRVRIVHGTGMGILRRTLREYLKRHPHVTAVTEPPFNEGGQGATLVGFRQ